jgi:hypothetical protein
MIYRITIETFLDVDSDQQALAAITEIMRNNLRESAPESRLVDWNCPDKQLIDDLAKAPAGDL